MHRDWNEQEMEAALEHKPELRIPADFATRVAARAGTLPVPRPHRTISYSRTTAVVSAVVLLLAMFALAPWTGAGFNSLGFDVELVMLTQLFAIGWWLAGRRRA